MKKSTASAGALVATSNAPAESSPPSLAQSSDDEAARFLVFGRIAEEVKEAVHTGNQPDVEAYARQYPQWAGEIRELVATLGMVNMLGPPSQANDQPGEAAAPAEEPARRLGDFRILREIGRGGMGVVYEAEQLSLSRRVALKTLPFAAVLDDRQIHRFRNEALAAAQLNHPHIVDVYGVGVERGVHYYVMRYIEGSSLAEVIAELRLAGRGTAQKEREAPAEQARAAPAQQELRPPTRTAATRAFVPADDAAPAHIDDAHAGPGSSTQDPRPTDSALEPRPTVTVDPSTIRRSEPPPAARVAAADTSPVRKLTTDGSHASPQFFRSAARIGIEIADALDHAHQNGVVHRDIKPSNLMLDRQGKAWVTDFGLCHIETGATLTMTGDLVGTLRYMSPEQALAKRVVIDHRTDIYSLGVTLYELLTLQPAFGGRDRQELLRQIAFEEPKPLRRVNAAVPEELETIVLKAIAKSPQERYATARNLGEDLRRFLDDRPILARRPTLWQRGAKLVRRHKAVSATIAIATCLLVILGVVGLIVSHSLVAGERDKALDDKERAERAEGLARQRLDEALAAKAETTRLADELARELYVADMNLAMNDWEVGNVGRVHELLTRHIPGPTQRDLRGFEWYYLWRLYQRSSTVPRLRAGDSVWSLAVSPGGGILATGLYGGVSVWDATSRERLYTRQIPGEVVHTVALSPDGKTLATSGQQRGLQLWDAETGEPRKRLSGHEGWIFSIAFSPDGARVASASWDKTVKLWDVASGNCLHTLQGHTREVFCVAFSPNGQLVASGGWEGNIKLWDVTTGEPTGEFRGHENMIVALAFSPDGETIATASRDKTVGLWDVARRRQRMLLRGPKNWVTSVAYSPDGEIIAAGDGDNAVRLWDARTGELIDVLKGHAAAVTAVAFAGPDGRTLISGCWDRTVRFWDLSNRQPASVLRPRENEEAPKGRRDLPTVDISPDAARVAAGGVDGRIHVWRLSTGERMETWTAHENWVVDVAFHPHAETLASASWDGTAKLWDLSDATKPVATLTGHTSKVQAVAFSPDGKTLATSGEDTTVQLWDVETWSQRAVFRGHAGWVNDIEFSPTDDLLASADSAGTIHLWSLRDQREMVPLRGGSGWMRNVSFSSDGEKLATAEWDGSVTVWDVKTVKRLARLRGHASGVLATAFSPSGSVLATGGTDYRIQLWDTETGQQRGSLAGHTDDVNALVFSPRGDTLLSASDDGTVRIWRAGTGDEPN